MGDVMLKNYKTLWLNHSPKEILQGLPIAPAHKI